MNMSLSLDLSLSSLENGNAIVFVFVFVFIFLFSLFYIISDENGVDIGMAIGQVRMVSAKPGPLTMSLMSQSIWRYHQIDKCYQSQALPMDRAIHLSTRGRSRGNFERYT